MTSSRENLRFVLWIALGLVLAVVLMSFVVDRRSRVIETVLRDWASGEVAQATDSTYQLSVSGVDLSVLGGRIIIDSIRLHTDTSRNDFRAEPLPVLNATATGCGVRGVNVWSLLLGRGVNARLFRCEGISGTVLEVVRRRVPVKPAAETPKAGVPLVSDSIHLPSILPLIVVHNTELPNISLEYTRRASDSSETHVSLERLGLVLRETRIDPAVPPKARRPMFSAQALLSATALEVGSEQQSILLGQVRANLTDSTLAIDSVVIGPPMADAEWLKLQDHRRDLIRMELDSARFRGLNYRRLGSVEGGIVAKRIEVFDLRVHVTTYKSLPIRTRKRRRSPQQFMAALDRPVAIDTVIVDGGRIAYTEHAAGKPAGGTMTWEKVQARIVNLNTSSPEGAAPPPVVITASALLLGQGKLETTIEIPLTASRYDMKYSGTLGAMPLTAISAFSEPVLSAAVTSGTLQSVRFSVVVRNGRSVGQITPIYQDFKLKLTDKDGSFLKKAGLAIVSLFANTFKVRGSNPNKPGETPKVGRINHPYSATASLPQFFWFALREGLGKVFVK
jgi:hypothetical protein